MTARILTFTNLFPSATWPHHGRFIQDRMRRVVEHSGLDWRVVCPVPRSPRLLRRKLDRAMAAMPPEEVVDGANVHNVHYPHVPGLSVRKQATRVAEACLPVVRDLAADRPTVIDAHYLYPDGVAALRIASELGLPCVVTARGSDVNVLAEIPSVRRQLLDTLPGAARLLAVSGALRDRLGELLGDGAAVTVARNGVDLAIYEPGDRVAARERLGLPQDRAVVLGVGRLVANKGFHLAAEAVAGLDDRTVLALVGDGPERDRIARLLPSDRVCLLGSLLRDDVVRAYQASDLFVLPSDREGWPNVVTEALGCGLPVVASAVGGIPEILAGETAGSLVPPRDVDALRCAIQQCLADPPDPAQVRALAERYSWNETVSMLSDLFKQLVA